MKTVIKKTFTTVVETSHCIEYEGESSPIGRPYKVSSQRVTSSYHTHSNSK
jgi:hypothetical protein